MAQLGVHFVTKDFLRLGRPRNDAKASCAANAAAREKGARRAQPLRDGLECPGRWTGPRLYSGRHPYEEAGQEAGTGEGDSARPHHIAAHSGRRNGQCVVWLDLYVRK